MGHRANYAIRQNGNIELYYSHWGALTVAEDVFWGPDKTEAFIRANDPTEEWLNDIWAEGGIAFDKDNCFLTYYYFEWPDEEDLRRVYESLLEETWKASGWAVKRACAWQEIAAAVGVDPGLVTAPPTAPITITLEKLGENLRRPFCCGLLSVRTDQGWQDRAIDFKMAGLLVNGPALIDRLASVADLAALRAAFQRRSQDDYARTLGDWIDEYGAIDVAGRRLRVSFPEYEERSLPFVQQAWAGWVVVNEPGGAAEHFAHTGREVPSDLIPSPKPPAPPPPNRPYQECVRIVRERLGSNETSKSELLASHKEIIEKLSSEEGPLTLAPGFLKIVPSSQPGWFDRMKLALRLIARKFRL